MQITFDTTNPSDLRLLERFLNTLESAPTQPEVVQNTGTAASAVSLPFGAEGSGVSAPVVEQSTPAAPEKKRGRPAKEKAEPVVEVSVVDKAVDEPAIEAASEPAAEVSIVNDIVENTTPATLDDVRAALQGFVGKNGMPAGLELLKEFECARISELSTDQYAAFLARCAA